MEKKNEVQKYNTIHVHVLVVVFLVERGHSDDGENNWVDTGLR